MESFWNGSHVDGFNLNYSCRGWSENGQKITTQNPFFVLIKRERFELNGWWIQVQKVKNMGERLTSWPKNNQFLMTTAK